MKIQFGQVKNSENFSSTFKNRDKIQNPLERYLFVCDTVTLPMGAICTSNIDTTYNYKCTYDGNFDCLDPTLWAVYTDTLE